MDRVTIAVCPRDYESAGAYSVSVLVWHGGACISCETFTMWLYAITYLEHSLPRWACRITWEIRG